MNQKPGSVWWAELAMGTITCLTAVVFALSHTTVGPFARVTVVFSTVPWAVYVVAAAGLGLKFIGSGVRKTPYLLGSDAGSDGPPTDAVGVPGESGEA